MCSYIQNDLLLHGTLVPLMVTLAHLFQYNKTDLANVL